MNDGEEKRITRRQALAAGVGALALGAGGFFYGKAKGEGQVAATAAKSDKAQKDLREMYAAPGTRPPEQRPTEEQLQQARDNTDTLAKRLEKVQKAASENKIKLTLTGAALGAVAGNAFGGMSDQQSTQQRSLVQRLFGRNLPPDSQTRG